VEVKSDELRSADGAGEVVGPPLDGNGELVAPVDAADVGQQDIPEICLPDSVDVPDIPNATEVEVKPDLSGDVSADGEVDVECIPDCDGKECGDNGCGGECGECQGEQEGCVGGVCVCLPICEEKECGDDGCGGSCGECDDGNPCTDDSCDPTAGCVYENNALPCDDSNWCTDGDKCGGGLCLSGVSIVCDDNNVCTSDTCVPAVGCVWVSNNNPCEDDDKCTSGDFCLDGNCIPGAEVVCDDGNPCTDDSCSPAVGCAYTNLPDGIQCSLESPQDVCADGQCVSVWWKDSKSKLVWQITPTGGAMQWDTANTHCSGLSLDGSGWRLPSIDELRTLIRACPATESGGTCNVQDGGCIYQEDYSCADASCGGCASGAGPANGCYWPDEMQGDCDPYWSSTPSHKGGCCAWCVDFFAGTVKGFAHGTQTAGRHVRCVRDAL